MPFWAYMLHCADRSFYVGHTDNLDARMAQHMAGTYPGHTKNRRPVTLVWSECFPTRLEALEAERRIKGWSRAKKLALIREDWPLISELARNRQERPSTSSGRAGGEDGTSVGAINRGPVADPLRAELVEAPFFPSQVQMGQ